MGNCLREVEKAPSVPQRGKSKAVSALFNSLLCGEIL
jgi:hypothetical protein